MAFRKRTFKRKFKRTFKRKGRKINAGVTALKLVKKMQRAIEYKHNDYPIIADDMLATGQSYNLTSGIQKGDNSFQRTGDTIKLARAHVWLTCSLPTGATATNTRSFRIVLIRGIRENTVQPVMSVSSSATKGVFDNTTMPTIISRKALDNVRDSKILMDKIYTLTPGQKTKFEFRYNFKLGWVTRFGSGTGNIDVPEDGGLYMLVCEDYNNGDILLNINSRLTFSDL